MEDACLPERFEPVPSFKEKVEQDEVDSASPQAEFPVPPRSKRSP
jgi:hypothetical protein